ncbi:MAG: group III truncated hemoglobin [Verrucomicrobiales bacterium]|nr:group III truncated hemoglobin [Verrucomicrobiales bacterium]
MKSSPTPLPDLENREDINRLVHDFYGRVRADDLLGPVFDDIAGVDWDTHIPKIADFWETALFRTGNYKGNPLRPHLLLSLQTTMDREKFQRWLELFFETVDSHFQGENAGHIKRIAADMAEVMQARIASFGG